MFTCAVGGVVDSAEETVISVDSDCSGVVSRSFCFGRGGADVEGNNLLRACSLTGDWKRSEAKDTGLFGTSKKKLI